jgi:hypothetical protein
MTLMTFQPRRGKAFQFLDDFAVAAHRAVEPLQIAVDHPDHVVEVLARAERDGAERFRLVDSPSPRTPRPSALPSSSPGRAPAGNG